MYRDLIIVCMYIYFLDRLSTCLYYLFGPEKKMSHNTRWFFIHSFTNLLICYMAKKDVYDCITDPKSISLSPSYAGQLSIWTAILAHIYHVVVFSHKLTFQDWLHHSLMVGVSGTVTVISPFKLSVLGLWFMSGLPGFIDYFNLWCVKMGWMSSLVQKRLYTYIATYIRSPGCLYSCFLGLEYLKYPKFNMTYLTMVVNGILSFWNGQYYLRLACIDYGKKLTSGGKNHVKNKQ